MRPKQINNLADLIQDLDELGMPYVGELSRSLSDASRFLTHINTQTELQESVGLVVRCIQSRVELDYYCGKLSDVRYAAVKRQVSAWARQYGVEL